MKVRRTGVKDTTFQLQVKITDYESVMYILKFVKSHKFNQIFKIRIGDVIALYIQSYRQDYTGKCSTSYC